MKKVVKIILLSLAALIAVAALAVGVAVWFVFTPEKLTPIVRKEAAKILTCQSEIGSVELTFFSTFPSFGLKAGNVALINPTKGAQNDTLFAAQEVVGVIDFKAWWDNNQIVLSELKTVNGSVNIYTDSLAHTNYDVFVSDTAVQTGPEEPMGKIDFKNVELANLQVTYVDESLKFNTQVKGLHAQIAGTLNDNRFDGTLKISQSTVWLEYEAEKYLQGATVKIDAPTNVTLWPMLIKSNHIEASVNDLPIEINGSLAIDTLFENFTTDLTYKLEAWPLKKVLALTPPSYTSYLKGVDADGLVTSSGKVTGVYNDSLMPLMDVQLSIANGSLKYDGFDLPLSQINGQVAFYSDMANDAISYLRIDHLEGKSPNSSFATKGTIDHLFSDLRCKLESNADVLLSELNPLIPANMKTKLEGRALGEVKSDFTMSQIEKMQLDKMMLNGKIGVTNLSATYDSLSVRTDKSDIEFALPNPKATDKKMRFAAIAFTTSHFDASKLKSFDAKLTNANVRIETSDVRDTTKMPTLNVAFKLDELTAGMDTLRLQAINPEGKLALAPRKGHPLEPIIDVTYQGGKLLSSMGKETVAVDKLSLNANVENDAAQKDIFLQWLVKGFVDLDGGKISLTSLKHPLTIPSIKMDFDPENIHIKEGSLNIANSDFSLTGKVFNVLSYFRGDSILRSDLTFKSQRTDITQLMDLTNGIGAEDTVTTSSGPYMVPKKMDLTLHTDIQKATFGIDTISQIGGDVRVMDGILVLDDIKCTTPATKMQLTAMYRSDRRNHLFLGIDYHMFDVDIENLLKMIPDIDTIMPMLKSFKGKAEFHTVTETYMDSLYNMKKSTIRSSSSIKGNDLVLMDGATFSEIAKSLNFKKKTQNKVDTLAAEFTVFKNEIDIYPFLIVMDKYKAVVAGRHNLDMTYKYKISVVDCPLPIKLGVDITGNMDDFKYKVTPCLLDKLYRPSSQNLVQKEQIDLRKMMFDALKKRLKR